MHFLFVNFEKFTVLTTTTRTSPCTPHSAHSNQPQQPNPALLGRVCERVELVTFVSCETGVVFLLGVFLCGCTTELSHCFVFFGVTAMRSFGL
eukprot:m.43340 g.43340  ORF g.43340 m.43340 type:complete len:93 (-) comp11633_c0_seq1:1235-1513(-)